MRFLNEVVADASTVGRLQNDDVNSDTRAFTAADFADDIFAFNMEQNAYDTYVTDKVLDAASDGNSSHERKIVTSYDTLLVPRDLEFIVQPGHRFC